MIVEKVPKSTIPDIDKKKFLVPADLSGEWSVKCENKYMYIQVSGLVMFTCCAG